MAGSELVASAARTASGDSGVVSGFGDESTLRAPAIPHEQFCPLVDKGQEPRVESFPYLGDDPTTGRTRVTHEVHRCLDCGAATYIPRS